MTIQLIIDNVQVPVKHIRFSDGSSNVKLEIPEQFVDRPPAAYYAITVETTTPVDNYLWEILLVQNAIRKTFVGTVFKKKILRLPYLPHGRADRVFEVGNALPLEIFLDEVLSFTEICLTDPHSTFYMGHSDVIDLTVKYQHDCFIETVGREIQSGDVLVSPDKGALNKIYKLQKKLDYTMIATTVIEASKKRDVSTGRIVETNLPGGTDVIGKCVFIVDDCLDAGGTFIPLANKLKEAGAKEVHLYITHGIFAKGLNIFKGVIDKIHCYQTVGNYVNAKDLLDFNNRLEVK